MVLLTGAICVRFHVRKREAKSARVGAVYCDGNLFFSESQSERRYENS